MDCLVNSLRFILVFLCCALSFFEVYSRPMFVLFVCFIFSCRGAILYTDYPLHTPLLVMISFLFFFTHCSFPSSSCSPFSPSSPSFSFSFCSSPLFFFVSHFFFLFSRLSCGWKEQDARERSVVSLLSRPLSPAFLLLLFSFFLSLSLSFIPCPSLALSCCFF